MEKSFLSKYKNLLLIIGVLLLTFIAHSSYINNGFVWIDHQDIERGWALIDLSDWNEAFTSPLGRANFYRPLITLSYSLDFAIYQDWIPGYHLTNILLQLIMVLVSIFTARKVFSFSERDSLIVGLITGLHPLTFLPVGVITYRQEILVTILSFLALLFYAEGRKKKKYIYAVLSLASFILALFTKETAFVWIPGLIITYEIFMNKKEEKNNSNLYYKLIMLIGSLAIMISYLFIRSKILPKIWNFPYYSMTISEYIGTRIKVIGIRLLELISPLKPSLSDATRIVSVANILVIFLLILFIVILILLVKNWKKSAAVTSLVLSLGIGLAPNLNILTPPRFSAPHYGYFCIPVFAMLLILGYNYLKKNIKQELLLKSALIIFILIMAVSTFAAGFRFKNDLTLFEPEVKNDPYYREAHFYIGSQYFRQNEFDKAAEHLELAVKETPKIISFVDLPAAKMNLAGAYMSQGKLDEAEKLILEINPSQTEFPAQIPYNLALIAKEKKDYNKVIEILEKISPSDHIDESVLLLIQSYLMTNQENKADELINIYFPELNTKERQNLKTNLINF